MRYSTAWLGQLVDAARRWYLDEQPDHRHVLREAFEKFWNALPAAVQWEIDKRCGTLDAEGPAVGCDQWAPLAEMAALAESGLRRAAIEEFHELATPAVVLDLIQHARRALRPDEARLALSLIERPVLGTLAVKRAMSKAWRGAVAARAFWRKRDRASAYAHGLAITLSRVTARNEVLSETLDGQQYQRVQALRLLRHVAINLVDSLHEDLHREIVNVLDEGEIILAMYEAKP